MKILLAWIGATDHNAAAGESQAGAGPICAAVTETKYDLIALLNSYSAKKGGDYVKCLRRQTESEIEMRQMPLPSPTHFGEIYKGVVKTLEQIRAKHGDDVKLTFHISPGTQAMGAVWIILAKTRFPAELIESSKEEGVRRVSLPFDIS